MQGSARNLMGHVVGHKKQATEGGWVRFENGGGPFFWTENRKPVENI